MFPKLSYYFYPAVGLFVAWFLAKALGGALTPLILAFFLSYLLFPLVSKLEQYRVSRNTAALVVFLLVFGALLIAGILMLPVLFREASEFVENLPGFIDAAVHKLDALAQKHRLPFRVDKATLLAWAKTSSSKISVSLLQTATDTVQTIFSSLFNLIITLLSFFLLPVFFYYMICRFESIRDGIFSLIPRRYMVEGTGLVDRIGIVLSGYIRGVLLNCCVLGFLYALGWWLVGVKFGLLLGLATGALYIIPYVGCTLGLLAALAVTFASFEGWGTIGGLVGIFVLVQALDATILTPNLVGGRVGVSALGTMLALIIAGNTAGFWGMLIALPCAGIIRIFYLEAKARYYASEFYQGEE